MTNASRIVNRLRHVSSMVDDVLDASVLSAGEKLSLPFDECNLRELLQRAARDFNAEQADRVRLDLEGSLQGQWNAGAIRRIVDNLVGNALKYGAPDRPVTIVARATSPGVALSVHNFGSPISPGDQTILFQQFRRAKGTSSKSGWGLGLLVAKGLTEAHGGEIRVESKPESGTTFTVSLPWDSRRQVDAIPA
jgi:signal transduction histidine kinase